MIEEHSSPTTTPLQHVHSASGHCAGRSSPVGVDRDQVQRYGLPLPLEYLQVHIYCSTNLMMAATASLIKAVYRGRSLPSTQVCHSSYTHVLLAALWCTWAPIMRPQVLPAAAAHHRVHLPPGLRLEHLRYVVEEGPLGSVPLIVCSPADDAGADAASTSSNADAPSLAHQPPQRRRCVVMLHATGSLKEAMLPMMAAYGQAGYVTAAIDARCAHECGGGGYLLIICMQQGACILCWG